MPQENTEKPDLTTKDLLDARFDSAGNPEVVKLRDASAEYIDEIAELIKNEDNKGVSVMYSRAVEAAKESYFWYARALTWKPSQQ